jgi:hypothetical protein
MTPAKQFWALLKFQTTVNPSLLIMPIIFGVPLFLPLLMDFGIHVQGYHPGLYSLFTNQNLFFVGIFGAAILAPEKFQFGSSMATANFYGTEFLLTRAIDRPILYRVKAVFLYLLVLLFPVIAILNSARSPDIVVNEYSKAVQQLCLASVPGSTLLPAESKKQNPSLISLPRGNVLAAEWQAWVFLITAIMLQLLILALYPFKYAKWVFWPVFFGLILVPLFDITHLGKGQPTIYEELFFLFAGHQILVWILSAIAFVLTQLICEKRFTSLEL